MYLSEFGAKNDNASQFRSPPFFYKQIAWRPEPIIIDLIVIMEPIIIMELMILFF